MELREKGIDLAQATIVQYLPIQELFSQNVGPVREKCNGLIIQKSFWLVSLNVHVLLTCI